MLGTIKHLTSEGEPSETRSVASRSPVMSNNPISYGCLNCRLMWANWSSSRTSGLWNEAGECGFLLKLWYPPWAKESKSSTDRNFLVCGLSKLLLTYCFPVATVSFVCLKSVSFQISVNWHKYTGQQGRACRNVGCQMWCTEVFIFSA